MSNESPTNPSSTRTRRRSPSPVEEILKTRPAEVKPGIFKTRSEDAILTVDAKDERPVKTETQESLIAKSAAFALQTKRPLTGRVTALRRVFNRSVPDRIEYLAVVTVEDLGITVSIPFDEFYDGTKEELLAMYRPGADDVLRTKSGETPIQFAMKRYINARLGSYVDIVLTKLPPDMMNNLTEIRGSRLAAMRNIRVRHWYGKQTDGSDFIKVGDVSEARIICTYVRGIRVEIFGVETYIPVRELSYNMIDNCRLNEDLATGNKIKVRITSIERDIENDYHVTYTASVKAALEDPRVKALSMHEVGDTCLGVVTHLTAPTETSPYRKFLVFVTISGTGAQIVCSWPMLAIPLQRGSTVTVYITNKDIEKKQLQGKILATLSTH